MPTYKKKTLESSPISGGIQGPVERLDALGEIGAIERDARALGSCELVRWAAEVKDAELRIICGKYIPPNKLRGLIAFVRRNTGSTAVEVVARG